MKKDCKICGAIKSSPLDYTVIPYEYRDFKTPLPVFFETCDVCTSESAGLEESKLNKGVLIAFKSDVDLYYELEELKSNED